MANPICGKAPRTVKSQSLQRMDVQTLFKMPMARRKAWYIAKLSAHHRQLESSAKCNLIPKQLLAAVLLNELADINLVDVWQQALGLGGSLGIAQIQVDTAVNNKLLFYPSDAQVIENQAARRQKNCMSYSRSGMCMGKAMYAERITRNLVRKRLTMPEYAIEAAAREIRRILELMTKNLANPWQKIFGFSLSSYSQIKKGDDIYNYIAAPNQFAKEAKMAELVIAAYNSPDIVIAKKQSSIDSNDPNFIYRNGTIHGQNGALIATELFSMMLFH